MADINGTAGADTLNGTSGADVIHGLGGNDTINGGDGADVVYGDEGDDTLTTSVGPRDDLHGGDGNDHFVVSRQAYMWGDSGTDTFSLAGSGHHSRIMDFAVGAAGDRLDLVSFADTNTSWNGIGNPFALGFLALWQVGNDVFIGFDTDGGGDHSNPFLYLIGVDLRDLEAVNFTGPAAILDQFDSAGADSLTGTAALDIFHLGAGNDDVAGSYGVDTAVYAGGMAGYSVSFVDGAWIVTDIDAGNGDDGVDTLHDVEQLRFADGDLRLDPALPLSDLNPSDASVSVGGAISAGPSGGYVATWMNNSQVQYRVYGDDGAATGPAADAFGIAATGTVAIDHFANGGFVIVGQQTIGGFAPIARLFAADGTPQGPAFAVTGAVQSPADFRVEILADQSFVVAWVAGPGGDRNIFARHYAADGSALGDVVDLGDYGSGQRAFDLAGLSEGGFFVARLAGGAVSGQVYDADGTASGPPIAINATAAGAFGGISVDRLADGRLVVVFSEDDAIHGRIFDPADSTLGADFTISANDAGPRMPDVAALDDGGFVAVWEDNSFNGRLAYAQRFGGDGARIGNQITMSTGDAQTAPSVAAMPGGSWAAIWQDASGFASHVSTATYGPPAIVGTNEADTIHGGDADDTISGGGGDDVLDGGNGSDVLYGGAGGDFYLQDGSDGIVEADGQGIDTVETALLSYRLPGNVENAIGSYAGSGPAQTLRGNTLNNHLTGSGANDVLIAKEGDDLLVGGAGQDILSGGSGRDILIGGTLLAANLLTNGSFETQDGNNDARAYILAAATDESGILTRTAATLSGWQRATASDFELDTTGANPLFDLGAGTAALAMATGGVNQHIFQDVAGVTAGTTLLLSFAIARDAAAPAAAAGTAQIEVIWNGEVVGTFTATAAMTQQSLLVTAAAAGTGDAGANRLEFREIGDADAYGTLLDAVSLNAVADDGEADWVTYDSELDGGPGAVLINLSDAAATLDGVLVQAHQARDTNGDFDVLTGIESVAVADEGDNWVLGSAGANFIFGGNGNDHLDGGGGTDFMNGAQGDDVYIVDSLDDTVFDDAGTDEIRTGLAAYTLGDGNVENLTGLGDVDQMLTGNGAANAIDGGDGDDLIDGGAGADTLTGGAGDDSFVVDDAGDVLVEAAGGGNDSARASVSYALAAGAEIETLTTSDAAGTGAIDLAGNGFAQALTGNAGANLLDGGGGADVMTGLGGNDVYVVDTDGDAVVEAADAGTDEVRTTLAAYSLAGSNVENLTGLGAADQALTGSEVANTITGNAGANILDGGAGDDQLAGGIGNDTYYVDSAGDIVTEAVGQGNDRIATAVSYTLAAGAEVETLEAINSAATGAMDLTGNGFANTITGNAGVNILRGEGGSDILGGLAGNDFLVGGTGADFMYGGTGDDTYYVDDLGDQTSEQSGEGTDRIATSISYALLANSEIELLEGVNTTDTNALDLTGSNFANLIIGNAGVNILRGEGGNDTLVGLVGNDFLVGGTGADLMYGGTGDDTYYVDSLGDQANEASGEGTDRIATSISFALQASSEVELLETVNTTDTNAMDLTGSDFANQIIGSDGVNILRGEGGNDTLTALGGNDFLVGGTGNDVMNGGAGNDTYYVDAAGDSVNEAAGEGSDRVVAAASYTLAAGTEVETLEAVTRSATNAMDLTGSSSNNAIFGNDGANTLNGRGGNDVLWGHGGADTFAFTTALGAGNVDRIADFVSGTDKIALDDAMFTGLTPGALAATAFVTGTQAQDADDRIVYNSATGQLYFDADGSGAGAQVLFATLDGQPPLAAGDFMVI